MAESNETAKNITAYRAGGSLCHQARMPVSFVPIATVTSYYGVGKSRRRRSGLAADVATFACSHSDESLQHSCAPARSSTVKRGALPTRAAAVRCRQPKSLRGHLSPSARFSQSSQKHHLSGFQWAGHVGNVSIG